MSKLGISTGTIPNDGTGDSLLDGAVKVNSNFDEIYSAIGDGSNLTVSSDNVDALITLSGVPAGSVGLGTFSSDIISDDVGVKSAFQELETSLSQLQSSTSSNNYKWSNLNDNTITGQYVTTNTSNWADASIVYIHRKARHNIDMKNMLENMFILGAKMYIQRPDVADKFFTAIVSGPPVITGSGNSQVYAYPVSNVFTEGQVNSQGMSVSVGVFIDTNTYQVGLSTVGLASTTFVIEQIAASGGGSGGVGTTENIRTNTLEVIGISTFNDNVRIPGGTGISKRIELGDSQELSLQYNTSTSRGLISSPGDPIDIQATSIRLLSNTGESGVDVIANGQVSLYYDNVKKFETTDTGVTIGAGTSTNTVDTPALLLSHNNPTVVGTAGTTGEFKQIGGQPYYYDGTAWRALFLEEAPLTANSADSDWDNTMIRMNFDQATIGDVTNLKDGRTPTTSVSDLVSAPLKYGSKSLRMNSSNSAAGQVLFSQNNNGSVYYPFEGGWTLEGWFYFDPNNLPGSGTVGSTVLFSNYHPSTNTNFNWAFGLRNSGTSGIYSFYWQNFNHITYGSSAFILDNLNNSLFVNSWNHFALVRQPSDGSIHFFFNGSESSRTTGTQLIDLSITDDIDKWFSVGYYSTSGDERKSYAIIDDIRISKIARYTSNFTPPTTALPTTGSTTTVVQPPDSKFGEITLGSSPTWSGTPGVTVSQITSGTYRAVFATQFTNSNDYIVQTSMNDYTPNTDIIGVSVDRGTTHADFHIRRSDGATIDSGSLVINLIKK